MNIEEVLFADIASTLGDRAFPVTISREGKTATGTGCTKRELFAAMAMQGVLANPNYTMASGGNKATEAAARIALHCADALLAVLAADPSR